MPRIGKSESPLIASALLLVLQGCAPARPEVRADQAAVSSVSERSPRIYFPDIFLGKLETLIVEKKIDPEQFPSFKRGLVKLDAQKDKLFPPGGFNVEQFVRHLQVFLAQEDDSDLQAVLKEVSNNRDSLLK